MAKQIQSQHTSFGQKHRKANKKRVKTEKLNPLPIQFKSLLPGQEGCVFFNGHLNLPVQPVRMSTFRPAGDI
jgi:hypothetical protein